MNWVIIWKVVFVALLSAFGLMSVLVMVRGAADIRKLLAALKDEADQADAETSKSDVN